MASGVFAKTSTFNKFSGAGYDPGAATSSSIILRGSLVSFNAAYGSSFFDLNWNTIAGQNYDHFIIERSLDGQRFEQLGEVKASDISLQENYSFRDNIRPALARKNDFYYRLKQVDANGQASYSKVLIARMYNSKALAALSITPDPAINDILVNVQLKEKSFVLIKVTDNAGNQVMRKTARADNGFNTYQLDGTHALQPGEYNLEVIINSNERMTMKLVKG
jgi:hypothetical protein